MGQWLHTKHSLNEGWDQGHKQHMPEAIKAEQTTQQQATKPVMNEPAHPPKKKGLTQFFFLLEICL